MLGTESLAAIDMTIQKLQSYEVVPRKWREGDIAFSSGFENIHSTAIRWTFENLLLKMFLEQLIRFV